MLTAMRSLGRRFPKEGWLESFEYPAVANPEQWAVPKNPLWITSEKGLWATAWRSMKENLMRLSRVLGVG